MQALQSTALRPSPLDPLRKPQHSTSLPSNNAKPPAKRLPFTISASASTVSPPKRETDPKKRVVITGMGLVSVFGNDVDAYYEKLLAGESGITPIDRFDASKFPTRFGGQIRGFKSEGYIDGKNDRRLDDCLRYCIVAGKKALEDADLGGDRLGKIDKIRAGVLVGTGMGGLTVFSDGVQALIEKGYRKITPFFIPYAITNMGSALLAIDLGLMGPNYSISTACATSNYCFYAAANHIRRGEADLMIAGGTEAAIIPIGLGGFVACRALSQRNDDPKTASRPWDKDRDGFVMGEGAGVLVMESLEHAMKRDAPIIAEYLGGAVNCDAYHMTDPRADGLGVSSCIQSALEDAGVSPEEVNYINAHATSTVVGDLAEVNAIKKSMIGHCLGAAGGLEAIATVKGITTGWLHPTINQFNPEPSVEFDTVANKKQQHEVNVVPTTDHKFTCVHYHTQLFQIHLDLVDTTPLLRFLLSSPDPVSNLLLEGEKPCLSARIVLFCSFSILSKAHLFFIVIMLSVAFSFEDNCHSLEFIYISAAGFGVKKASVFLLHSCSSRLAFGLYFHFPTSSLIYVFHIKYNIIIYVAEADFLARNDLCFLLA
ncbi:3-oxoacyl-[acyl-carrier-protein] synthase I, chloroplastic [Sesamum angolense]|uniref:3-oxoacyl-[acyl-carrier-protein] synthase I, chloroplastic n=1 Tax=Sesamum angolense TaxID=2727404 RepID=A0AAE1WTF3_9LAMI|nr:3-oxoacyl-[acyl-carrier-protein] synthase I, chloroplastic [Sesamum angolense]